MRTLLTLSFVAAGVMANAGLDMDHVNPIGTNLVSNTFFGIMQIFPDQPDFNGTVIDDFISSGTAVSQVDVAFETNNANLNFALVQGWQVSIWASPAAAGASGVGLNGGTVAQMLVPDAQVAVSSLAGTGAQASAKLASITGLNLGGLTVGGHYWIGVAPVLDFTQTSTQTFILNNLTPALLGAGTANDEVGIQPLNGFGLGTTIPMQFNAAYAVTTVPEPATLIALGAGLAAFARRRRNRK
jgi:hypothetical protein